MKFVLAQVFLALIAAPCLAEDVAVDFGSMKVGTKLTTRTVWHPETTYIEEYIGLHDGHFLIQNHKVLENGSTKEANTVGYDEKGRKVFSRMSGKTNTYTPFSCYYVVGECSHTYKYYNHFTKKYVSNEDRFKNRLEGDTLFLGVIRSDGSMFEVPFKLGPHRLRLSNVHTNALGQPTGFKFLDLTVPE